MIKKLILTAILFAIVGVVGGVYYLFRHTDIQTPPKVDGGTTNASSAYSTIGIDFNMPYDKLTAFARKNLPETLSGEGKGADKCGTGACVATHYNYKIAVEEITIDKKHKQNLRIVLKNTIKGTGSFPGYKSRNIGSGAVARDFDTEFYAYADVTIDLNGQWCPKITMVPGFYWTKSDRVQIVNGIYVGLRPTVESQMKQALLGIHRALEEKITCDHIVSLIKPIWVNQSIPINLDGNESYLNIEPKSAMYAGVTIGETSAALSAAMVAKTVVSRDPIKAGEATFRNVEKTSNFERGLEVMIALYLDYQEISDQLADRLAQSPLTVNTSEGPIKVSTRDAKVYPSGDLTAGLLVDHAAPDALIGPGGWIYLTGEPGPGKDNVAVALIKPGFSTPKNQDSWNSIASIMNATIKKEMETNGVVDLMPRAKKLGNILVKSLSEIDDNTQMQISKPTMAQKRVSVNLNELLVELILKGDASIKVALDI